MQIKVGKGKETMGNLSVRKIEPHIYEQLQKRASKHGVSMEEEVRRIIRRAVQAPDAIGSIFQQQFGQAHGIDLTEVLDKTPHQPLDLS